MSYIINTVSMRAARALLDWTQEQLAKKAGLTQATIANLEIGKHKPSKTTSILLKNTFERWGVELLPFGAKLLKGVRELTGEDAALRLLEDAYHYLKETKGEILIFGGDERQNRDGVLDIMSKMRTQGIKVRVLVAESNNFLLGPLTEYRKMPDKYFVNSPVLVYGDKLGIFLTDQRIDIAQIIMDPSLAEAQRRLFNFVWDNSKPPKETAKNILSNKARDGWRFNSRE